MGPHGQDGLSEHREHFEAGLLEQFARLGGGERVQFELFAAIASEPVCAPGSNELLQFPHIPAL